MTSSHVRVAATRAAAPVLPRAFWGRFVALECIQDDWPVFGNVRPPLVRREGLIFCQDLGLRQSSLRQNQVSNVPTASLSDYTLKLNGSEAAAKN